MKHPYRCYRCGYQTSQKVHMMRHLYKLAKECPGIDRNVELTEEIKDCILKNRVYHPIISTQQVFNQTINNYHQINNIITKMDTLAKIENVMIYKNSKLISLEDRIEKTYEYQINKLETKSFKEYYLEYRNLLEVIDKVTDCECIDNMNVVYDTTSDKLQIYNGLNWQSLLFEQGACELVRSTQTTYLDVYETYLIDKFLSSTVVSRDKIRNMLSIYYTFLASFDLHPSINANDHEVLYDMFVNIQDNIKMSEVKKIKARIYDIIKNNAKKNMIELNKHMMEIIQIDEDFKNKVLLNMQISVG